MIFEELIEMYGGLKPFYLALALSAVGIYLLMKAYMIYYSRPETREEFEATQKMLREANDFNFDE